MTGPPPKRAWIPLVALLLAATLLRIAVHLDLRAADPTLFTPQMDAKVFLDWARDVAGGHLTLDRPFFLNPLYPYLLAAVVLVARGHAVGATFVLQGLLGIATVWLVASSTLRMAGRGPALFAGALAAAWPLLLYFEGKLMIVTLAVFLNALALRLLVRFSERRTSGAALLAGLALGLGIVARPNLALFVLLIVPWVFTLGPAGGRWRFGLSRAGVLLAAILVVAAPVTIHNARAGGELVPLTTGAGANLWQSNNPESWRTGFMASPELRGHPVYMERDMVAVARRETGEDLSSAEASRYFTRKTLAVMAKHPGAALAHLARKAWYFFRDVEIPSSYHYAAEVRETSLLRWIPLTFGLLSPLAAIGALLAIRRRDRTLPAALLFLAYFLALVIVYPYSHHRAPVLPAAFPLAAVTVFGLASLWRRRRRAFVAAAAALALAMGLAHLTTLAHRFGIPGLADEEFFSVHEVIFRVNRGIALLESDRPDEAEDHLRRAAADFPDSPKPWIALAEIARRRGEPGREAHCLEQALERGPDDSRSLARLAELARLDGDRERARELATTALGMARPAPLAHVVLGRVELGAGNPAAALRHLESAGEAGITAPELLAEQATCLRLLGRAREALSRVDRGLERAPGSVPLRLERVRVLLALDPPDRDEARREVERLRSEGVPLPRDLEEGVR